ncbi:MULTISPECIES: helix-turn-helix domain-containing protein [Methylobacterium]|uniref:XRE family transcriptional regulator n=1 Tax=Methylobacterium currus TaxID=2051553 RepID=A0A2R4WRS2_9HYPH|nr:helix-turn-helix transcriptional regulator [Methylobacterium sp. DB0501]AWB24227.1 XRE family transcriptional regulator [Methylobacterium currus]NGM35093.1 helix-turn-helix transcriptional regulator [Methylobacterium sp. DB0501]
MTQYVEERAVLARLESRVRDAGSAQALAESVGLSPQHLSDVRRGRRSVTGALAEALGVHVRRVYVEGPRPPEPVELVGADGEVLVRAERIFS